MSSTCDILSRSFWSLIVTSKATGVLLFLALEISSKFVVTRISVPSSREAILAETPVSSVSVRTAWGLASTTILRMASADRSGLGSSQNSFTSFTENRECLRRAAAVVDYLDECSCHQGGLAVLEHVSPNRYSSGSRLDR